MFGIMVLVLISIAILAVIALVCKLLWYGFLMVVIPCAEKAPRATFVVVALIIVALIALSIAGVIDWGQMFLKLIDSCVNGLGRFMRFVLTL